MKPARPKRTRLRAKVRRELARPALGTEARQQVEARLGHAFRDPTLLDRAMTHASLVPDQAGLSYQRLEFLGDRVLGLVIAERLYRNFEKEREGGLAARLNGLVHGEACAEIAAALGLSPYILIDPTDRASGTAELSSVLADVMEAVIGALYLDGGLAVAEHFILRHWKDRLAGVRTAPRNAKSALQERVQGAGAPPPVYTLISRDGPDHDPRFVIEVTVQGAVPTRGEGTSKQAAQLAAATAMLAALEDKEND